MPNYKLSRKEVGFLLKCLRDPISMNGIHYNSAWEFICVYITNIAKDKNINVNYIGLQMPDYTKLK